MSTKENVIRLHQTKYGKKPTVVIRAPGRINLIGEHTDYNGGSVLPAAIDKYMYFSFSFNGTKRVNAHAVDLQESISFPMDDLVKTNVLWTDFLIGILKEFKTLGIDLKGFNCAFSSEIPQGAGMSSSSALECAFLLGVQELHGSAMGRWDLINMSKSSNHNFLGIKGGIMDQFASLYGKKDKVMLLDCNTQEHEYIPVPPSDHSWLLINTCVKHNHLTSEYNERVRECGEALKDLQAVFPETNNLSSIKNPDKLSEVGFSSPIVESRARFVVEENARVRSFVASLNGGNLATCGELLYASHAGLRDDYVVSCEELDWLVEYLRGKSGVQGSRMMGGGFGGCTINLIHKDAIDNITAQVSAAYRSEHGIDAEVYGVNIADGAERLA